MARVPSRIASCTSWNSPSPPPASGVGLRDPVRHAVVTPPPNLMRRRALYYSHSHVVVDLSEHEGHKVDEHMNRWSSDGWRLVTVIRRQISGAHPTTPALEYTFFWEK
jgi:hypothetical protein